MTTAPATSARPRRSPPLSVRLAAIVAVLLAAGLASSGILSVRLLRGSLMDEVDQRLTTTLRSAEADIGMLCQSGFELFQVSDYTFQCFTAAGDLTKQLPDPSLLPGAGPHLTQLAWTDPRASGGTAFTVDSNDGTSSWRVLAVQAQYYATIPPTPVATALVVAVGTPLDSVNATVGAMSTAIAWIAAIIMVVGTAIGFALVRGSLRQLRRVEVTAAQIAAGDLSQRVPPAAAGTEVGRLTDSINAMLTQIETAFDARAASEARMRRFVSDASHELRTPLAAIRGYGELYRMGALKDPEELAGAMRRIEDEAKRMGSLVGDLLQLTRLDEGGGLRHEVVDLGVLAADAAADLRALDPTRQVRLVALDPPTPGRPTDQPDGALLVWGDEDRLRQVLTNLVGNAARHTPAGSPVELAYGLQQGPDGSDWVVVELRDHGPGIPADQASRVFERFFRLDSSRTRASGGSGLGLAIVASIVAAHGGRVTVSPTPGGGATFRLDLPRATGGAAAGAGVAAARGAGIASADAEVPAPETGVAAPGAGTAAPETGVPSANETPPAGGSA